MKYRNKIRLLNTGRAGAGFTALVSYITGGVRWYMHSFSSLMNEAETKAYLFLDETERRAQEMSQNIIEQLQNTTANTNTTQLEELLEKSINKVISGRTNDFFPRSGVTTQDIASPLHDLANYMKETYEAIPPEARMPLFVAGVATLSYLLITGESRRIKMNRKAELENNEEFNRIISSENKRKKRGEVKSNKKYEDMIEKEIQESLK